MTPPHHAVPFTDGGEEAMDEGGLSTPPLQHPPTCIVCATVVRPPGAHMPLTDGGSAQEDDRMRALVEKYGARKWSIIASNLPGRVGKQCRER